MDDIENDAILLLSLLDENIFPHFLEWNKGQRDLSKWILFLLQTDYLSFKGLTHGKEERAKLAHFAYHIKHANNRCPLLTDKEISTLDRLCNSRIPFKVALSPICQHIWRTVMIRTRQLAASKYWSVMHSKIVTNPEATDLDFVLSNETYRRYFDRFLQTDPAELAALHKDFGAAHATPYVVVFTDGVEAFKVLLFGVRSLQREFFPSTSSSAASATSSSAGGSSTATGHRHSFAGVSQATTRGAAGRHSSTLSASLAASAAAAAAVAATAGTAASAAAAAAVAAEPPTVCAGLSDTSRVEILALLAQHTSIKTSSDADSLDHRFALAAAKTLYDVLLRLERALYVFLQRKFQAFVASQEYMKLIALVACEQHPQVWKYLARTQFLEGDVRRAVPLLHWASAEAAGVLYVPIHSPHRGTGPAHRRHPRALTAAARALDDDPRRFTIDAPPTFALHFAACLPEYTALNADSLLIVPHRVRLWATDKALLPAMRKYRATDAAGAAPPSPGAAPALAKSATPFVSTATPAPPSSSSVASGASSGASASTKRRFFFADDDADAAADAAASGASLSKKSPQKFTRSTIIRELSEHDASPPASPSQRPPKTSATAATAPPLPPLTAATDADPSAAAADDDGAAAVELPKKKTAAVTFFNVPSPKANPQFAAIKKSVSTDSNASSVYSAESLVSDLTTLLMQQLWRCNVQQDVDLEVEQDNHHWVLVKSMELQVLYQHLFGTTPAARHSLGQLFLSVHTRLVHSNPELRTCLAHIQPSCLVEGNFPHLSRGKYRKVVHVSLVYAPAAAFVHPTAAAAAASAAAPLPGDVLTPQPYRSCYTLMQRVALAMQHASHLPLRRMDAITGVLTSTSQVNQLPQFAPQPLSATTAAVDRIAPFSPAASDSGRGGSATLAASSLFDSPPPSKDSAATAATAATAAKRSLLAGAIVLQRHKLRVYDDESAHWRQLWLDCAAKAPLGLWPPPPDAGTGTGTAASGDAIAAPTAAPEETLYDVYLRYPRREDTAAASAAAATATPTKATAATKAKPPKTTATTAAAAAAAAATLPHVDSRRHLREHDHDDAAAAAHAASTATTTSAATAATVAAGAAGAAAAAADGHSGDWTAEERAWALTRQCGAVDFAMAGVLTTVGLRLWLQLAMLVLTDRHVLLVSSSPTLLAKVFFMLQRLLWPLRLTCPLDGGHSGGHSGSRDAYDAAAASGAPAAAMFPQRYPAAAAPFQAQADPVLQAYYAYLLDHRAHDPFFSYVHTAEELFDYFGVAPHAAFSAGHPSLFYLQRQRTASASASVSVPPTPFGVSLDPTATATGDAAPSLGSLSTASAAAHEATAPTAADAAAALTTPSSSRTQRFLSGIVNTNASSTVASPDGTPAEDPSSWHARATAAMLAMTTASSTASTPVPPSQAAATAPAAGAAPGTAPAAAATAAPAAPAAVSPSLFSRVVCVDVRAYRQAQRLLQSAASIGLPFAFPADYDDARYSVFDLDTAQQIAHSGFLRRDAATRHGAAGAAPSTSAAAADGHVSPPTAAGGGGGGGAAAAAAAVPSFNGSSEFSPLDLRNPLLFRTANFAAFRQLHATLHDAARDLFHSVVAAQLLTKPPPAGGGGGGGGRPRVTSSASSGPASLFGRVGFRVDEYHHSPSISLRASQPFLRPATSTASAASLRSRRGSSLRRHRHGADGSDGSEDDEEDEPVRTILTTDDDLLLLTRHPYHSDSIASIASVLTGSHLRLSRKRSFHASPHVFSAPPSTSSSAAAVAPTATAASASSSVHVPDLPTLLQRLQEQLALETAAIRACNVTVDLAFHQWWLALLLQAVPDALHFDPHAQVLGCDMQRLLAQLLTANHGELRPRGHHSHSHGHGHGHSGAAASPAGASAASSFPAEAAASSAGHAASARAAAAAAAAAAAVPLVPTVNGYTAEEIAALSFEDFLTLYNDHTATAGVSLAHAWYAECLAGLSSSFLDLLQRHGRILLRHAY
eukprot:gene3981-2834_t